MANTFLLMDWTAGYLNGSKF